MLDNDGLPVALLIRDLVGRADFSDVAINPDDETRLRVLAMWYPFGPAMHHVPLRGTGDAFMRLWTCESGVLRTASGDEVLCLVAHLDRIEPAGGSAGAGSDRSQGHEWVSEARQAVERVRSRFVETGIFAELGGLGEVSVRVYIPHYRLSTSSLHNAVSGRPGGSPLDIQLGELTGLWGRPAGDLRLERPWTVRRGENRAAVDGDEVGSVGVG